MRTKDTHIYVLTNEGHSKKERKTAIKTGSFSQRYIATGCIDALMYCILTAVVVCRRGNVTACYGMV